MEESNLLILSTSLDEMFVMLKDKNNKIYKKNLLGKKIRKLSSKCNK